jgi:membrane-bound lytic murein transglycosylase A
LAAPQLISRTVRIHLLIAIALLGAVTGTLGCQKKKPPAAKAVAALNFTQELPPGQMALEKIAPGQYPDFAVSGDDLPRVRDAVRHSLTYIHSPSSRQHYPYLDITHERAVATLERLAALLDGLSGQPPRGADGRIDLNAAVRDEFEVYKSIGAPKPDNSGYSGQVLFTGYFTPIYEASLTRQGPYQWPLYKRPADLVGGQVGPDGNPAPAQRQTPAGLVPYPTRQEIEQGGLLQGQELVWLTDRWQAYVITVQGSARLRLPDERVVEVGYAGTNGQPYVSPGRRMVDEGAIRKEDLSLKTMGQYFAAHPEAMDRYLWLNPRTTFFTFTSGGPFGSLGVPVTPLATIATDKSVYPRGMPAFLVVPIPNASGSGTHPFRGLMLDQDTGGAIRAAGRCDIYMGVGPAAEQLAGRQLETGELYYLAIKPERVGPPGAALRPAPR